VPATAAIGILAQEHDKGFKKNIILPLKRWLPAAGWNVTVVLCASSRTVFEGSLLNFDERPDWR
jgi:hypothetical protein